MHAFMRNNKMHACILFLAASSVAYDGEMRKTVGFWGGLTVGVSLVACGAGREVASDLARAVDGSVIDVDGSAVADLSASQLDAFVEALDMNRADAQSGGTMLPVASAPLGGPWPRRS